MKASASVELFQYYKAKVNGHLTTVQLLFHSKRGGYTAVDMNTARNVHVTVTELRAKAEAPGEDNGRETESAIQNEEVQGVQPVVQRSARSSSAHAKSQKNGGSPARHTSRTEHLRKRVGGKSGKVAAR